MEVIVKKGKKDKKKKDVDELNQDLDKPRCRT